MIVTKYPNSTLELLEPVVCLNALFKDLPDKRIKVRLDLSYYSKVGYKKQNITMPMRAFGSLIKTLSLCNDDEWLCIYNACMQVVKMQKNRGAKLEKYLKSPSRIHKFPKDCK